LGVWLKNITTAVSVISYVGFFGIMLLIVADVIMRCAFNSPIVGAYEIVQYILMAAVFASFAYCQSERGHVHVTMFLTLMPQKLRFFLYSFTGLLSTAIGFFVGYAAVLQAQLATASHYTTGVLKFVTYPFFWVEAVTMFVFAIAMLFDVVRSVIAIIQ
jgi:TRAP-type C4-dicarboxylate transport system permease small subunit